MCYFMCCNQSDFSHRHVVGMLLVSGVSQNVVMTFNCCGQQRKPDRADDVVKYIFNHMKPSRATGQRSCGGTQLMPPSWEALFEDVTDREHALAQQQQQQEEQEGQQLQQQGALGSSSQMHQGGVHAVGQAQQAEAGQAQPENGKRKRKATDKELKSAAPSARRPYGSGLSTVIEAADGRKYVASQTCKDIFKVRASREFGNGWMGVMFCMCGRCDSSRGGWGCPLHGLCWGQLLHMCIAVSSNHMQACWKGGNMGHRA